MLSQKGSSDWAGGSVVIGGCQFAILTFVHFFKLVLASAIFFYSYCGHDL